jgi:hypothetical protein
MKTSFIILCAFLCWNTNVLAQRQCGIEAEKAAMIAQDPSWKARFEAQRASLQGIADNYKQQHGPNAKSAERTTGTISPCPVVFHIIVSTSQLALIGGYPGIQQRVDSQMAVLNRDFNRQNSDSSEIPSGWKSRYGNVGIQFGLAHTDPHGNATPGYEVSVSSTAFLSGGSCSGCSTSNGDYPYAKYDSTGGLSAWDNTKYINVWCIYFSDNSGLLGITTPLSFTNSGGPLIPNEEMGICINFETLGKRASASDNYIPTGWSTDYYDQGRTLTHEMGHYFEIWHTWGDDGGYCPWNGGSDDGLADTPPEGNYHFYNWPDTIPGGTYYDVCQYNGSVDTQGYMYGIASLDYLNYTDDVAMHMFTTDQAAAMASMALVPPGTATGATGEGIVGETYSVTQNPSLLNYPGTTGVNQLQQETNLNIFPNPSAGIFNITFNQNSSALQSIIVTNMVGQEVQNINTSAILNNYYSIDLSGMSKGMYFVRCNFASGTITRKILLQ